MAHTQITFLVLLIYCYKNGQKIQFVKSCTHLANISPSRYNILVYNAVNDLNCRLLADFSHCNSSTYVIFYISILQHECLWLSKFVL